VIALLLWLAAAPKLDARLTEAFRAIQAGRYEESRRAVGEYLAAPDAVHRGQAEFLLGLSYHRQRLYESARTHFAVAVEREPDYVTTFFFYGFTLYNLGRLDEAERNLERYLAFAPEDPETHFGLGLVALDRDRVDDADKRFQEAIALVEARAGGAALSQGQSEDVARYQARLADVYLRRDDLPKARAALERSVELWPAHFEPWHKLSRVLERMGDAAGAARAQEKSEEAMRAKGRQGP
jgi:tetratricopeptide (TPR) repeat protein